MGTPSIVLNIRETLAARELPTITLWNRLEGRPRTEKFDRALRAEVRDALWMLTRQWQMGELRGDDAGSPAFARLQTISSELTAYQADGHAATAFPRDVPLEPTVERRPVLFSIGGKAASLDLRITLGRHWLKLVRTLGDFEANYKSQYSISAPNPANVSDAVYCAHPEVWSAWAAAAGRCMDGFLLWEHLQSGGSAVEGIPGLAGREADVAPIAEQFLGFFDRLFERSTADGDAWIPSRFEYQFSCAAHEAARDTVLSAEEYFHGRLDWYNLDIDAGRRTLGDVDQADPAKPKTTATLPVPVVFQGMPDTRWWAFEDRKTNFGDVKPDAPDISKLLLIEFALNYANDWFLIPVVLPWGTLTRVRGLAVTNVFGERTWIEAAGAGLENNWQRWAMFNLARKDPVLRQLGDTALLLPPIAQATLESAPQDDLLFIRDEMANMVWGVEKSVTLPHGSGKSGSEAAIETRTFFERDLERRLGGSPGATVPPSAPIRYRAMTSVPENWIPFIPVHVPGSNREVQLQRASMPRILEGDPVAASKVRPRTVLLREGLDGVPARPLFVHEEEIPRAGVRVRTSYQRTRRKDGRPLIWLGVRKQTGRGEGWSGLAFDHLVDQVPKLES